MKTKRGYICDKDGFTGHVGDINPFKDQLPKVMVMKFSRELGHSQWVDFIHSKRSLQSLLKCLRKSVKSGEYSGYRLMIIHKEVIGVE